MRHYCRSRVLISIWGMMFISKTELDSPCHFGWHLHFALLELFVAAYRAYIFKMFVRLYFGSALKKHHDINK